MKRALLIAVIAVVIALVAVTLMQGMLGEQFEGIEAELPDAAAPEPEPAPVVLQPPAGANGGSEGEMPADLRHTGRDVLFAGEAERLGYPLYSYLLIRSAGSGVRQQRFERAIEAFVGQVSEATAMEAAGAPRAEINVFYLPLEPHLPDLPHDALRDHLQRQHEDEQTTILKRHYHFDRAEVILDRLQLSDSGPYILLLPAPVSGMSDPRDAPLLVQNLSSVPPDLIALWVVEFKRQVVQESQGTPESLRRFALNLRTEIAVLAEAFAITRTAVAEMFSEPN